MSTSEFSGVKKPGRRRRPSGPPKQRPRACEQKEVYRRIHSLPDTKRFGRVLTRLRTGEARVLGAMQRCELWVQPEPAGKAEYDHCSEQAHPKAFQFTSEIKPFHLRQREGDDRAGELQIKTVFGDDQLGRA